MKRRRRLLAGAGGTLLFLVALWLGGFGWFIAQTWTVAEIPPDADGIVALTGGAERVEVALHLLERQPNARLLISGIGGATDLPVLARRAGLDPAPLADRVTLGRAAMSTRGNAIETGAWVREYRIQKLVVVTAFYHMPRALTELRRRLPDVALLPHPVGSFPTSEPGRAMMTRLLVEEYTKYLVVAAGLSGWFPAREARA